MPRYRVTLTRLIEEECTIYVQASDIGEANEIALRKTDGDDAIASLVWRRTDVEPHSYAAECEDSADVDIRGKIAPEGKVQWIDCT